MFLEHAKERGYQAVVDVGSRGLNIAANVVVNAAVKGHGVVTDKLKSYSVMDLRSLPDDMPLHSRHGGEKRTSIRVRFYVKFEVFFCKLKFFEV